MTSNEHEVAGYSEDNKTSILCRIEGEAHNPTIDNVWFEFLRTKLSYYQFCAVIDRLCKKGLVEPSYKFDTYYRMYFPGIKLRLAGSRKKKTTYLEAINCVSYAFEEGSTFGLYRILKKDAVFESKSSNKVIEGRDNIINYIVPYFRMNVKCFLSF